jgi:hypothetical protein
MLHLIELNHFINHLISSYLISISNYVSLINYDADQGIKSPFPRSNGGSNRLKPSWGFPTTRYIQVPDLHISTISTDPPKHELDRTTREHSTPPPCSVPNGYLAGCVYATPAISPLLVCVINSHNEIAEILRLTGVRG